MRRAFLAVLASMNMAVLAPSNGSAQSAVVDLSKPQMGKSEFVLNADFTAANLGGVEKDINAKKPPSSPVSDWCASGCRMAPTKPEQSNVAASQAANRSSVVVVSANTRKIATEAAASKRSSSRIRIGRRR